MTTVTSNSLQIDKQRAIERTSRQTTAENSQGPCRRDVAWYFVPDTGSGDRKSSVADSRQLHQYFPVSSTVDVCISSDGSRPSSSHVASLNDATAWIFITFVMWPRSFGLCHPNLFVLLLLLLLSHVCYSAAVCVCTSAACAFDFEGFGETAASRGGVKPPAGCSGKGRQWSWCSDTPGGAVHFIIIIIQCICSAPITHWT